jgi:hypothetical protein
LGPEQVLLERQEVRTEVVAPKNGRALAWDRDIGELFASWIELG